MSDREGLCGAHTITSCCDLVSHSLLLPSATYEAPTYTPAETSTIAVPTTSPQHTAATTATTPPPQEAQYIVVSALGASVVTAFAGVIAFLCLVAPHIARLAVGNSHRYLVPASMLVGAVLLLMADDIGRSIISPAILPVGIVLSFIGAPLLLYLLLRGGE